MTFQRGAPLCSIERGRGNKEEAEAVMGNSFILMVVFGLILTAAGRGRLLFHHAADGLAGAHPCREGKGSQR